MDLARDVENLEFREGSLISATALLDLVSAGWLDALIEQCCPSRSIALFALTYDGRISLQPTDDEDQIIWNLVNTHQLTDKGFGPALGWNAPAAAATAFTESGFMTRRADSSWRVAAQYPALQAALVEGWAEAAKRMGSVEAARVDHWRNRRQADVNAGRIEILVGHEDLLATPAVQ